ncbi:MAG: transposase [Nostoc sp.]|uniref:transposase n=1 Tax=Nostoc sp. TaxID=1180 RepID=UPI002FFCD13D
MNRLFTRMSQVLDHRDDYGYGYSPQKERFHDLKSGRTTGRVNMISACIQQLPFFARSRLKELAIERYLKRGKETCLIPTLRPGQKLVIDNATFDKGGRIEQLVRAVGCEVWYLPPYSPDLNRIEKCWS